MMDRLNMVSVNYNTKINTKRSKVMKISKETESAMKIVVAGEVIEQVKVFCYFHDCCLFSIYFHVVIHLHHNYSIDPSFFAGRTSGVFRNRTRGWTHKRSLMNVSPPAGSRGRAPVGVLGRSFRS